MVSLVAQVEGRLQTYRSNPLQYDIVLMTLLIGCHTENGVRDILKRFYFRLSQYKKTTLAEFELTKT